MNAERRAKYLEFVRLKAEHPAQIAVLKEINASLDQQQAAGGVTVFTGPTGIGKSNLVERLRVQAILDFKANGSPAGKLPFLSVTATPPMHDTFRFPSLFREILDKSDEILRNTRSRPSHLSASDALEAAAMNVLRYRQPTVFCIDEAQHITYAVREQRLAQHLDLIKWIASESKRPVLMVGTYELLRFSRISGQLGRRVNHIAFAPYDWLQPADVASFRTVLDVFIKKSPARLAIDPAADKHFRFLFAGCLGSIGLLKEWLERALYRCLDNAHTVITEEDLLQTRMKKGKLLKIAEEHERGLLELRLLNEDRDGKIETLLGMAPAKTVKESSNLPPAPTTPKRTPRPFTRTIKRDPVGEPEAA